MQTNYTIRPKHLFAIALTTMLLAANPSEVSAQSTQLKALQISSTIDNVWNVQPATVSSTVVGTPQATFTSDNVMSTFRAWGTCFNELDWHALSYISDEARARFFHNLFSPNGDLHFSIGRIPIGASDYSCPDDFYSDSKYTESNVGIDLANAWYSCDEMPTGETDFDMEHFTIERDQKNIIPYIKAAQAENPDMQFWASPWSPPQWMKKNNHYSNRPGYGNGLAEDQAYPTYTSTQFIMEDDYLQAYAKYFSKFIDAYGEEGIPVKGICYQNEAYTYNYYPNTSWMPEATARFNADYLIPYLREHNPGVKVWLGTMNTSHVNDVFLPILNYESKSTDSRYTGKKLSELFDGIAFQWEGRDAISEMRSLYPDLEFIMSEAECGNGTFDWAAGTHQFELIHHYLNNGCVTYSNWNAILAGDGRGPFMNWHQNGLLHLDRAKKVAYYTAEYYAYKHYSHFIGKDTKILRKSGSQPLVLAAERPDGTYVIVVGNEGSDTRHLTLSIDSDKYLSVDVPAKSYNTFLIGSAEAIDEIAAAEGMTTDSTAVTDCTSFIQNPTFASTTGWSQSNNPSSVSWGRLTVLNHSALNSFSTSFTSMDTHQDIQGLPAGTYYLTCRSVCGEGLITDQHAYISTLENGTATATATSPVKQNDSWDELSYELQQTDTLVVGEGQTVRIGYASTSNGGQTGWFAVTDFRLYRLGEDTEGEAAAAEVLARQIAEAKERYDQVAAEAQAIIDDPTDQYDATAVAGLSDLLAAHAVIISTLQDPAGFDDLTTQLTAAINQVKMTARATTDWTGSEAAAGDFYLYNVGAGRFLDHGGYWGTQAVLLNPGVEMTLVGSDNAYAIDTKLMKTSTNHFLYFESGTIASLLNKAFSDGAQTAWTFTEVDADRHIYTISKQVNGTTKYLGTTADEEYLGLKQIDDVTAYAQWQLITRAQRDAALADASADAPADASYLLANPNFSWNYYSAQKSGWTNGSAINTAQDTGVGQESGVMNQCAEIANKDADICQELTDLPDGVYELSVQGFYDGGGDKVYTQHADGTEVIHATLYAGADSVQLMSTADDAVATNIYGGKQMAEGVYYPNGLSSAMQYFHAGLYTDNKVLTVVENGTLKVGLRVADHIQYDWTVFDAFRLSYLGPKDENGEIVAIYSAQNADARVQGVYAPDGRRLPQLQRGINIVRMSDGSVQKVLLR